MGGRDHRDRLGGRIDAVGPAALHDLGKPRLQKTPSESRRVQPDMVLPPGLHLVIDRTGHDIPGSQLTLGVVRIHEPFSVQGPEFSSLPPQGLGDQEPPCLGMIETGRVELNELQVRDAGPGPEGHGQAVTTGKSRDWEVYR